MDKEYQNLTEAEMFLLLIITGDRLNKFQIWVMIDWINPRTAKQRIQCSERDEPLAQGETKLFYCSEVRRGRQVC